MKRTISASAIIALCVAASCGGKVLVDGLPPGVGAGGAGGAGGSSTTNSTADGVPSPAGETTGVATSAAVTTVGTGGCDPNYTCAEAITPPSGDPKQLCSGTSAWMAYEDFIKCTCGGPCSAQCSANICIGMDASPSCTMCIVQVGMGCGKEFESCANN